MFKKILIGLIVLIGGFGIVVAMQPDEFRVSRTSVVDAPAAAVFEHVNNLKKWDNWSPWAKLDPSAKTNFVGPEQGVDAVMHWSGNNDVGEGSMKIIKSQPSESVQYKLDFLKPMKGTSTAEFSLVPEGQKTSVTWTMYGEHNYIQKAMCLVFNGKKMLGEQFEQGLSNLNTAVSTK